MDIIVKKPNDAQKAELMRQPTWECGISEFDWYYDSEETCLLVTGEVTVTHSGGNASFSAGDMVTFPRGLSCIWKVTKPVKKHYVFN